MRTLSGDLSKWIVLGIVISQGACAADMPEEPPQLEGTQYSLSGAGGPISRAEVIDRARNWFDRRGEFKYDSSRASATLITDVDGQHRYGADCSGMVSMAWHLTPGSVGGLNTHSLPNVSTPIDRSQLQAGDILDYPAEHVILFEAWEADHAHFSYYTFGSTPMKHITHASFSDAKLAGWPTGNYSAYRYNKINDGTPPEIGCGFSSILRIGASGDDVRSAQELLKSRGYTVDVDGEFGEMTEDAVKQFQRDQGLDDDGEIGPMTAAKLCAPNDSLCPALSRELSPGTSGDDVRECQQLLSSLHYTIDIDGEYGSMTEGVVRQFQTDNGLDVDGVIGPMTFEALTAKTCGR